MNKSRYIKTQLDEVAEYWQKTSNICETKLNFDWADCKTHCWNCGQDKYSKSLKRARLERCHIIPHTFNGLDSPSNFVLLCYSCHAEAPNTKNENDIWDWILSNKVPFRGMMPYYAQKALLLYKSQKGSWMRKTMPLFLNKENELDDELMIKTIKDEFENIQTHFRTYNISSYYYMFKNIADKTNQH